MEFQIDNSDSDDDVPLIELINRASKINSDGSNTISDVQTETTVPSSNSDTDECVIHVHFTNEDDTSDFFITDENGNLLCNNTTLTNELENEMFEKLDSLPFDPFDISLNDTIGSEIEIGIERNESPLNEIVKEAREETDDSESEYRPSTDSSESENENMPKKRMMTEIQLHTYAKAPEAKLRTSRKRKRNPDNWHREIRKRRRQQGKDYNNAKGERVRMKASKSISCKCKHKCITKIDKDNREQLFHQYWNMSYELQRSYISHHVKVIDKKRRTKSKDESRRMFTYEYFFQVNNDMVQVCKSTFMNVLDIGPKVIEYTMNRDKIYDTKDKRGLHKKFEISQAARDTIRKHIEKFPRVDSHYCRKDTVKQYLEKGLSVSKMYRLYTEECNENKIKPEKLWLYNSVFNNDFNLGFHLPKKDLCTFCEVYEHLDEDKKKEREKDYFDHQERKESVRHQKQEDKERASKDRHTRVINFDLQKVLISPKTEIGQVYYSRKLATYNFTVFDVVSKQASCFMWYETIAKRGSNDIASCMYKYNESIGSVEHLIYYSDSCSGQNRNLPFSTMCLYSVQNLPIGKITHNFFEVGHSQMEGDSVHATIEKATKKHDMFAPTDWMSAVLNSKISEPRYKVIEVSTPDIKDFKDLADKTVANRSKAADGSTLQWTKVHTFEYRKSEPNRIYYKYDFKSDFNYIEIARQNLRRKMKTIAGFELQNAYHSRICISKLKYDDLLNLCKRDVIPARYHSFYENLPHSEISRDEYDD